MKEERLKKLLRLSQLKEIARERARTGEPEKLRELSEPEVSGPPGEDLPEGPMEPERLEYEVGPVITPGSPVKDEEFLQNLRKAFPPVDKRKGY